MSSNKDDMPITGNGFRPFGRKPARHQLAQRSAGGAWMWKATHVLYGLVRRKDNS